MELLELVPEEHHRFYKSLPHSVKTMKINVKIKLVFTANRSISVF